MGVVWAAGRTGRLHGQGDVEWMKNQMEQEVVQEEETEYVDAGGNVCKAKEKLTGKLLKAKIKEITAKIRAGDELDSDDEGFAIEQDLS
jgi:hypothetical protein